VADAQVADVDHAGCATSHECPHSAHSTRRREMKIAFVICAILTLVTRDTIPGQVILGGDTAAQDRFSRAVDVSGRWMIIGAPNHDHSPPISNRGSAYVTRSTSTAVLPTSCSVGPSPLTKARLSC
jgi:hypothetical protein